jgi:hypothetical protein
MSHYRVSYSYKEGALINKEGSIKINKEGALINKEGALIV